MNSSFRNSLYHLVVVLAITQLICACADYDDFPNAKGDIVGYIKLTDSRGSLRDDHAKITVRLIGRVNVETVTNDNGKFEFKKVPAGSYSIVATKVGYDGYKMDAISHLGGSITLLNFPANSIMLAPKSPNLIANWTATVETIRNNNTFLDHYLNIQVSFDKATFNNKTAVIVFINDSPGASPESHTGYLLADELADIGGDVYEVGFYLFGMRPVKGVTQYVRVYPYNGGTLYKDLETGLDVFPSLGEGSTELTFTYE